MTISYRNGVSIAEIVVYIPSLFVASFLAIRHGFGRSSGWLFLIIFCLARIIGPCMQLATISDPRSQSLLTGSSILNNIGLSPLEMAALGLLSRLISSISKTKSTFVKPRMIQLIQLIIVIGLVLSIVGGIDASSSYVDSVKKQGLAAAYHPNTLNKAGAALLILCYALLVAFTAITYPSVSYAEPGEKRLFLAITLSLPFMLVRLVYSCISTYSNMKEFNLMSGNVTVFLCVALIEEFVVVVIFEATGLTLQKQVKEVHVEAAAHSRSVDSDNHLPEQKQSSDNIALRIAKKTIFGKIVMAILRNNKK
jgi:putative Ca2+/H+ antiporter (TMEM165/GDT1 family)